MIPISLISKFIKRGWWIILISTAVAIIAGYQFASIQPEVFSTSATYIVTLNLDAPSQDFGDNIYGIDALSRETTANTYSEIISSRKIFDLAIEDLNLPTEEANQYSYEAVVLPQTTVIRINVEGPDPSTASEIATNIGSESVTFVGAIYDVYQLVPLDEAQVPIEPISPVPMTNAILAGAIGAILGLLLALIRTPELILGNFEGQYASEQIANQSTPHDGEYLYVNGHGSEKAEPEKDWKEKLG